MGSKSANSRASRMRSRHATRESNQKIRTQLKAVTNTAITHDPIPHASPITLFQAVLYGQPRAALRIYAAADHRVVFCHFFDRVRAERNLRQQAHKHKDRECAYHPKPAR